MTASADDFAVALDRCTSEFGLGLIADREQVVAIVADLLGESGGTSARQIVGLRVALEQLAGPGRTAESSLRAAIMDAGVPEAEARWLGLIVSDRVGPSSQADVARYRRISLAGGIVAAALVGVIAFLVYPDDPDTVATVGVETSSPSPQATGEATVEASKPTPTPTDVVAPTAPAPAPTANPTTVVDVLTVLTAEFEAVTEGPFTVERTWTVDRNVSEIRGSVALTNRTSSAVQANHRELPPPAVVADGTGLQWSPEPAALVRTTGVFNLRLGPGELTEIGFVAPIDASTPVSEDAILNWFESWAPAQTELNSLLDSEQPTLLAPVIRGS